MFSWVALAAMVPGMASRISALISGVRRGHSRSTRAPDLRTPHQSRPAWLIPATISPYVIRAMGVRAAHRYFLTAERFSAQEAARIGLVHEVVAADQLDRKVGELALALVNAGPQAVKACKKLLHDVGGHEITAGLVQRTVEGIADIRASDEGREGVQSFLGKRKPNWHLG